LLKHGDYHILFGGLSRGGEIGAAIGIIVGGLLGLIPWHAKHFFLARIGRHHPNFKWFVEELGDLITRFSGITMTCIATGVIWILQPASLWDVIYKDYLHVSLYVGGLYFALRGNVGYEVSSKRRKV